MLSFIIIGRNEGWKLTKCLMSVFETIKFNKLDDAEVIYVDSQSTDDSIDRAKAFEQIKIFLITGECNAAIARNIGAKESKGDILFFIDGDMEIEKEFLTHAILNNQLKYDCVTGHRIDYAYDNNDNLLEIRTGTFTNKIPDEEQSLKTNGGIFLIKKDVWEALNGMLTKYRRSQDIDLSLRLIKKSYKIIRLPKIITKHHTFEYGNEKKMWTILKHGFFKFPAMIFRNHISMPYIWKRLFRLNYTEILFLATTLSFVLINRFFVYLLGTYIISLLIRSYRYTTNSKGIKNKFIYFLFKTIHQLLSDILFWFAFFFYYPTEKKLIYKQVQQ